MRRYAAFLRPKLFFQPLHIWRKMRRAIRADRGIRLAWGLPVEVNISSGIGYQIWHSGVHDRVVPETIGRLLDPGEHAIDIGANIGQNASMMALATGRSGRVTAFEPGPEAWNLLTRNLKTWAEYDLAPIVAVEKGISSRRGPGRLHSVRDIGGFTLEDCTAADRKPHPPESAETVVELTTLDAFVPEAEEIALVKIDVEGHELAVLEGAEKLLAAHRVRDLLFEDFQPQPSPVTRFLWSAGYTVFYLHPGWRKPKAVRIEEAGKWLVRRNSEPNFLATFNPRRAELRFQAGGWMILRMQAPHSRQSKS